MNNKSIYLSASLVQAIGGKQASAIIPFIPFLNTTFRRFQINTDKRIAMFMAQAIHESQCFRRLSENLNYSADGLRKTWPKRFSSADAAEYGRKPEKIANHVYAKRHGNGDENSGDGWKYRGRGIFQITFKDNYRACGKALGIDLISKPELLAQPEYACLSAGWYWDSRSLNAFADKSDVAQISKVINGGINGLEERKRLWANNMKIFTTPEKLNPNYLLQKNLKEQIANEACKKRVYGRPCNCILCRNERSPFYRSESKPNLPVPHYMQHMI